MSFSISSARSWPRFTVHPPGTSTCMETKRRWPAELVHQLRGIQDGHPAGVGPNATLSVPDGVAKAMSEHYLIEDSLPDTRELPIIGACPDCASGLTRQEGCVVCHSCGYSKCS